MECDFVTMPANKRRPRQMSKLVILLACAFLDFSLMGFCGFGYLLNDLFVAVLNAHGKVK